MLRKIIGFILSALMIVIIFSQCNSIPPTSIVVHMNLEGIKNPEAAPGPPGAVTAAYDYEEVYYLNNAQIKLMEEYFINQKKKEITFPEFIAGLQKHDQTLIDNIQKDYDKYLIYYRIDPPSAQIGQVVIDLRTEKIKPEFSKSISVNDLKNEIITIKESCFLTAAVYKTGKAKKPLMIISKKVQIVFQPFYNIPVLDVKSEKPSRLLDDFNLFVVQYDFSGIKDICVETTDNTITAQSAVVQSGGGKNRAQELVKESFYEPAGKTKLLPEDIFLPLSADSLKEFIQSDKYYLAALNLDSVTGLSFTFDSEAGVFTQNLLDARRNQPLIRTLRENFGKESSAVQMKTIVRFNNILLLDPQPNAKLTDSDYLYCNLFWQTLNPGVLNSKAKNNTITYDDFNQIYNSRNFIPMMKKTSTSQREAFELVDEIKTYFPLELTNEDLSPDNEEFISKLKTGELNYITSEDRFGYYYSRLLDYAKIFLYYGEYRLSVAILKTILKAVEIGADPLPSSELGKNYEYIINFYLWLNYFVTDNKEQMDKISTDMEKINVDLFAAGTIKPYIVYKSLIDRLLSLQSQSRFNLVVIEKKDFNDAFIFDIRDTLYNDPWYHQENFKNLLIMKGYPDEGLYE